MKFDLLIPPMAFPWHSHGIAEAWHPRRGAPLHLLQQEGGQVGLLEANLFRGHLGGQRHDGRLAAAARSQPAKKMQNNMVVYHRKTLGKP